MVLAIMLRITMSGWCPGAEDKQLSLRLVLFKIVANNHLSNYYQHPAA